ncbi:LysR family transcriptional regulator, partial [Vibrio parahaemolyticus]|nr:LysR family transcriptional regulator [Vibrio parahaemolyticus]
RLFAATRHSEKEKRYLQAFFATARLQCKSHLDGIKVA